MSALFALVALVALIAIFKPLPRLYLTTRKRAALVCVGSAVLMGLFSPEQEKRAPVNPMKEAAAPLKTPQAVMPPPVSWKDHAYQVVENKDISFANRKRLNIRITAPTAETREDRIATLMEAAIREHRKTWPDFISVGLQLEDTSDIIAQVDYAPDGCGVSGKDCTDEMWTNVRATEGTLTPEQFAIQQAWDTHKSKFKEETQYGAQINEEQLKVFLAKEFDTTPEHIWQQMVAALTTTMSQQEVVLPEHQKKRGALTEADKEMACRHDLQCWGDKGTIAAGTFCDGPVERLAKYAHQWTDGWLEPKFSRFRWKDREKGHVTYIGDKIQFQNGFGAFQNYIYECDFDPVANKVLDVRARAGKL